MTEVKPDVKDETDVEKDRSYSLILHNDDVHSFDFVIDALINICEHTLEQAEQCTLIAHHKGQCEVKMGNMNYLLPYKTGLQTLELTVTIE